MSGIVKVPVPNHVGHRAARDAAEEPAAENRDFRRPPAHGAETRAGEINEEPAATRLLEERAEDDEDDYEGRRYAEGHPKDPLGEEVVHPDELSDGHARMIKQPRQVRADERVYDEHQRHQGQRRARGPAGRLENESDGYHPQADIEPSRLGNARRLGQRLPVNRDVETRTYRQRHQRPIDERYVSAGRTPLGEQDEDEGEGERQVHAPLHHGGKDFGPCSVEVEGGHGDRHHRRSGGTGTPQRAATEV